MAQALLARAGFDPHKVLEMSEAEVESHLSVIRQLSGVKPKGESNTSRFKGHRKNKS
jgi:hypothetical protein